MDCGADDNFIDTNLAEHFGLPLIKLKTPKEVSAIDGTLLEVVTHQTQSLKLTLSGNHQEFISLYIIQSPLSPIVLGLPQLKIHNPHIDWTSATICGWHNYCHEHCLHSAIPEKTPRAPDPPKEIDLTNVPREYHDLH